MKVIIAGTRFLGGNLPQRVDEAVEASGLRFFISEVVSGRAPGIDSAGEVWAKSNGIPVQPFPAKWRNVDGSRDMRAGFKRNQEMADYADALIAVWDGKSNGTCDMICRAVKRKLRVYIHYV